MIPKKIYYCWFGKGKMPQLAYKCIESWKKYCPDYEIIEINETNFNVDEHPYTSYFYKKRKFAFVSDYVRLKTIYENGGLYMDIDVEMFRNFDDLLTYDAFFGFEYKAAVNSGLGFGATSGCRILYDMMQKYNEIKPDSNGNYAQVICTKINTDVLIDYGLELGGKTQYLQNDTVAVFSLDYLNPLFWDGVLYKTENTYSKHWCNGSWITPKDKLKLKLSKYYQKIKKLFSN